MSARYAPADVGYQVVAWRPEGDTSTIDHFSHLRSAKDFAEKKRRLGFVARIFRTERARLLNWIEEPYTLRAIG